MSLEPRKIYSIADLVRETGIPNKQVNLLLEHHGDVIPFLMDGERRRYTPEAIPVLSRLWREYKKGIKEDKTGSKWYGEALGRLRDSGDKLSEVANTLRAVQAELRDHPPHRIFYINAFPGGDLHPTRAIAVHVDIQGTRSRATLIDADLEAYGESDTAAVMNLREVIMRTYLRLEEHTADEEAEQFSILSSFIKRDSGAPETASPRGPKRHDRRHPR
jgi:hypothetical protein